MKRVYSLLLCLLAAGTSIAQTVGELQRKIDLATSDSQRISGHERLIDHYARFNADSALYHSEQALQYAIKKRYTIGEARILAKMAKIDEEQGREELARQRYNNALRTFTEYRYAVGIASVNTSLGTMEANKGNFNAAVRHYFIALKISDSLKDNKRLLVTYTDLGIMYLQQGDMVNAEKYIGLGEQVSKKLPLIQETIFLYNIIGDIYSAKGENDKALAQFEKDLQLSDTPGLVEAHVESMTLLGNYYIAAGQPQKAMPYLLEGLEIAKREHLDDAQLRLYMFLSRIVREKDPKQAMAYLNDAMAMIANRPNKIFKTYIYDDMAAVYKQQGNFQKALETVEERHKYTDSIFNINRAKEIASISAAYELDKSNTRIRQLELQNEQSASERNAIVACTLGITVVLMVMLFLYRKITTLNKQLVASNATKDRLFSIIGHDLRGPIATIPMILKMYEDEGTNAEEKQYLLDSLKKHTNVSAETLDKLLYWGQSLIKGTGIQQTRFEAKPHIASIIELNSIAAKEKELVIADDTASSIELFADATHFDFIIRNLLSNAIKFTRAGGQVTINADDASRPGMVVFSVRDTGMGIAPQDLPNVFTTNSSAPGTANEKGTGIGLMLCKEFAELNGGSIWAESEPGKGSTFYFSMKKG